MNELPPSKHYNLTHYQQRYNWDCGISCILMILAAHQRRDFLNNFDTVCKEEGFGSSTWTIDLCYLLLRYQVRHEYLTKTIGIDPNYTHHSYYSKIVHKDDNRVTRKFKDARANGLQVEKRSVTMDAIVRHLSRNGPVIVLTNASMLTCDVCKRNVSKKFGYSGHYVVLSGYDVASHKIFYHNPEVEDGHTCRCLMKSMDSARRAYGTDEDLIFIYQKKKPRH